MGLAAWVLFVAVGTELWYRSAPAPNSAWWRVEWPEKKTAFAEIPLSSAVKEMAFDVGRQAHWREDDGTLWTMFHFRWLPGLATTRIAARWHNPDICLVAAGFKRVAEYEPAIVQKGDVALVFRTYRFDAHDRSHYVFFCVWEDRRNPDEELRPPDEWNPSSRIRAVLDRKRHLGQQVLEVVISGIEDEAAARAAFEARIPALLRPDSFSQKKMGRPIPLRRPHADAIAAPLFGHEVCEKIAHLLIAERVEKPLGHQRCRSCRQRFQIGATERQLLGV